MRIGRFSKKSGKEKPENTVPDNEDTDHVDTENVETRNDEMLEDDAEVTDIQESELNNVPDELNEEMAALQAELVQSQDKFLRLAAEFDNYRKRTLREKTELIQTAGESLLKDILPFVDDFERGLEVATHAADMDAVRTGMEIIYSKLKDFLTNHGVKEIKAMNEPFDADWHDAVTNIPAPSDDLKGKIVDVIQKGYTLNDKVMRYPKVVVGE